MKKDNKTFKKKWYLYLFILLIITFCALFFYKQKLFNKFTHIVSSISFILLPIVALIFLLTLIYIIFNLIKTHNERLEDKYSLLKNKIPILLGILSLFITLSNLSKPIKEFNNKIFVLKEEEKYFFNNLDDLIDLIKTNKSDKKEQYIFLFTKLDDYHEKIVLDYDAEKYTNVNNKQYIEFKNKSSKLNYDLKIVYEDLKKKEFELNKDLRKKYEKELTEIKTSYTYSSYKFNDYDFNQATAIFFDLKK